MAQIPEETETFSSTTSENGSVPKTEVEVLPFKEETSTASVPPPLPKVDYLPSEYDVPTISTRDTANSAPAQFDISGGATLKRPSKEKKSHRAPPPEDPPPKKKKEKKERKEERKEGRREGHEPREERRERKEKKEKGRGHSGGHGSGSGQGRSGHHSGQGHGKSRREEGRDEGSRSRGRHHSSSRSVERPSSHSPHPGSNRTGTLRHRSHSPHHHRGHCGPDDDDAASNQGSNCDCPAHVHDRESPLEIAEVRDAVRVSRTLKLLNRAQPVQLLTK